MRQKNTAESYNWSYVFSVAVFWHSTNLLVFHHLPSALIKAAQDWELYVLQQEFKDILKTATRAFSKRWCMQTCFSCKSIKRKQQNSSVCVFVLDQHKQQKDPSIYSFIQAPNDSQNHPPVIKMAHQFNYFTTQACSVLSKS